MYYFVHVAEAFPTMLAYVKLVLKTISLNTGIVQSLEFLKKSG